MEGGNEGIVLNLLLISGQLTLHTGNLLLLNFDDQTSFHWQALISARHEI